MVIGKHLGGALEVIKSRAEITPLKAEILKELLEVASQLQCVPPEAKDLSKQALDKMVTADEARDKQAFREAILDYMNAQQLIQSKVHDDAVDKVFEAKK